MNILFICKKYPFLCNDGESIVIFNDFKVLEKLGHNIFWYIINDSSTDIDHYNNISKENIKIKNKDTHLSYKNFLSKKPFHLHRFMDESIEKDILNFIYKNKISIIICQGLPTFFYNLLFLNKKIFYRVHNIEYYIWEKLSQNSNNIFLKLIYKIISFQLKRFELEISNKIAIKKIALTSEDKYFHKTNSTKINTYINNNNRKKNFYNKKLKILIVGSMNWRANKEGIKWFLDLVYPYLKKENIELTIAGKGSNIYNYNSINLIENYDNIFNLFETNDILMVPLLSGSGVRIKILEAMSYGMPLFTTKIGCSGIDSLKDYKYNFDSATEWISNLNYFNRDSLPTISKQLIIKYQNEFNINDIIKKWEDVITIE